MGTNERQPESALLERALGGDASAFAQLCERHRERVWRIVHAAAPSRAEADDLVQEAIVRAYCARHTYRHQAPFEAWLCRIALNAAHDWRRSAWKRRVVSWPLFWSAENKPIDDDATECPTETAARNDLSRRVRAAVAALPDRQRDPIWLHFFEEFTLAEIARLEGIAESTLRSRLQAGLGRLQKSLRDLETEALDGVDPLFFPRELAATTKGCEI